MSPRPARPWFRFYVEAMWDRKLRRLTPSYRWLWVCVLAVARSSPAPGVLLVGEGQPAEPDDLADAAALRPGDVRGGMVAFEKAGMVDRDPESGAWRVAMWDERQFEGDHARSTIADAIRAQVFTRDGSECVECGASENLTIDHVTPYSKGGSDEADNLQTLCGLCNSRKGNRERQARYRQRQRGVTDNATDDATGDEGSRSHSEETETDRTDQKKLAPFEAEFNAAWEHYPRKDERKAALEKYQARRRAGATAEELALAVQHYAAAARHQGTERRFIKHGKTFFGHTDPWREFLAPPSLNGNASTSERPVPGPARPPDLGHCERCDHVIVKGRCACPAEVS